MTLGWLHQPCPRAVFPDIELSSTAAWSCTCSSGPPTRVTEAVIGLPQRLRNHVVAEGVETEEARDRLTSSAATRHRGTRSAGRRRASRSLTARDPRTRTEPVISGGRHRFGLTAARRALTCDALQAHTWCRFRRTSRTSRPSAGGGRRPDSASVRPSAQRRTGPRSQPKLGQSRLSFLVPAWWPLEPLRCRRSPQRIAHPVGGVAAEGRHDMAAR